MITRRELLFAFGLAVLAGPVALRSEEKQARRIAQIAWISATREQRPNRFLDAFREGLRDLGHIEGNNLVLNTYWAGESAERLASLATEIVALKPDVIVAIGTAAARAVQQATQTVPVVMAPAADPVGAGLVKSLAQPGGNITGIANLTVDLSGKTIELLREAVPNAVRIAVLRADNPTHPAQIRAIQDVAKARGLTVLTAVASSPEDIDQAFGQMAKQRPQALVVLGDAMLVGRRQQIADLAIKQKWPSIFQFREHAEAGGLMSYGTQLPGLYRRAATYVDKILKGAKPADLPVEQPMTFDLVVNLKTAKAIGIKIPQSLLMRADQVIE